MLAKIVRECYGKEISECGKEELYHALLTLVQKKAGEYRKEETVLHISRVFDWKTAK